MNKFKEWLTQMIVEAQKVKKTNRRLSTDYWYFQGKQDAFAEALSRAETIEGVAE